MENTRPLRLLSFDGGGIRGLSSLYILGSIMRALENKVEEVGDAVKDAAHHQLLPCEYFDLIAGTSTGGLIALMLGTLRMDVDTCINEYLDIAPKIFPVEDVISRSTLGKLVRVVRGRQRFDPVPLEEAVKRLVRKHLAGRATGGEDTLLQFEASRDNKSPQCKVFVCATSEKLKTHVRFKTYNSWNDIGNCPIWQACRATSAAPTFFPPMIIGKPPTTYVDGGLGYNNPIRLLLDETRHIWPQREIGCIVSVGTGILASKDVGRTIKPLFESLKDIATDTEKVAGEFREEMKHKYGIEQKVYFRFNVQHGLEQVALEEWKEMDRTRVATHGYVMQERSQIEACASQLHKPIAPAVRPSFHVPFSLRGVPTVKGFVGRDSELECMEQYLVPVAESDRRKICVLHGLGGIGKTQLAIEHARLHKDKYTSVFWLDGKTEDSLLQSLLSIPYQLPKGQIISRDIKDIKDTEELKERAQEVLAWFTLGGNHDWLLIFDNIDKTSTLALPSDEKSPGTYDVKSYFPNSDQGSIIVTTRLQRLMGLGKSIQLKKVDISHGIIIFQNARGKSTKLCGHSGELGLVERLDGLPLALVLAGSFLVSTGISATKYLELYEKSWNKVNQEEYIRNDYANGTIATTWMISYNELKCKDIGTAKLLQLWGYLDNQDLWFELLQWPEYQEQAPEWLRQIMANEISFLRAIRILLDYSLIERNECSDSYSMHTVVHDWIREFVNKGGDNLFQIGITSVGLAAPGKEEKDYWMVQRRLLPHASRLSQSLHKNHVLNSRPKETYDTSYLLGLHNLGSLYSDQGKLAEAEAMYQRALAGYEKALGPEHTSTLSTVNNLGSLYKKQGKLAEAEAMYQRALAGYERALGPEHTSALSTVHNLGSLYKKQGKLAEAEAMYQRALAGYERALGPEHTSALST
ncbi:MAG: hypothetical protein M1813_001359, partial [Trichoglossum hirsutum]